MLKKVLSNPTTKAFVVPEEIPHSKLEVKDAFNQLSEKEKLYAHYISRACWSSFPISVSQTSEESFHLFGLFNNFFSCFKSVSDMKKAVSEVTSEADCHNFLQYVSMFYGNGGNYRSFGDTKFIPRLEPEVFEKIIELQSTKNSKVKDLYEFCKEKIFSLESFELELGFHKEKTNSLYYSSNITEEEVNKVNNFLKCENIYPENTRVFKLSDDHFEVRIASCMEKKETKKHEESGFTIDLVWGDFQKEMQKTKENLEKALLYCSNELEENMMKSYIQFYETGLIQDHIKSQEYWVKNKGPLVETNIGFIEAYRDPSGSRGEHEGWVAIVNKEVSKKYDELVLNAEELIQFLPWNEKANGFEKDKFLKPDYTSLEVLTFACTGVPLGINIPNYLEVRQNMGFKNVTLGNVASAKTNTDKRKDFLSEEDDLLLKEQEDKALEIGVSLHELLGHGTGKLLCEEGEEGAFNFDPKKTINPLTNKPVESWYKKGESWGSVFKEIQNSYEECRAESVSLYLAYQPKVLEIFKATEDASYATWVEMVWRGLKSLSFYSPETEKWRQAHSCARFVILQVLLESGILVLKDVKDENGEDDLLIELDRSRIKTDGMEAMGKFLLKLMVLKSTANYEEGKEWFMAYAKVDERFLKIRDLVERKRKPRRVFVQERTIVKDGKVELVSFESNEEGMIQSFQFDFNKEE